MDRKSASGLRITMKDRLFLTVDLIIKGKAAKSAEISISGHLDEVLIPALDTFLRNNRIDPLALGGVTIQAGRVIRNSSAYRIVHTWAAALRVAQNKTKQRRVGK